MKSIRTNDELDLKSAVSAKPMRYAGRIMPWLVLMASLALTLLLWQSAQRETERNLQADFDFRVREIRGLIEHRLLAYEYVLRGVQGLFVASGTVQREEFRSYVTNLHLEENYPGIQGVGYSLIVQAAQKDSHITEIRRQTAQNGYPAYTIRPEGVRELYTSIVYIEPFAGRNLRAFGYDMYSEPVRRTAMEQARDSGEASISGKVKLVQETEQDVQAGFLMYLPVYHNGVQPGTVNERRANIVGWVYAPFRMNDLMHGIAGERSAEIDIEIYDGEEISEQTFLYDADNSAGEYAQARFKNRQIVSIAGHRWTLIVHSYPAYEARLDAHQAELIAFSGSGASLLLALLVWSLVKGRERAERAAREMNRDLIRSEERARQAIAASHSALWDFDLTTGRVYLSEGWAQLLGGNEQQPTFTTIQELTALVPDDEQPVVRAAITDAVKGKADSSYQVTHRVRKLDGAYIWVLSEGRVTERSAEGQALRMIGTNRDITERIVAEKKTQELNADLAATLQAIPDLLFELGQNGEYLNVWANNPELLAAQKEQLLGRTVSEVLPPEAAIQIMSSLKDAGKNGYSRGQVIRLALPHGDSWFELSTAVKETADRSDRRFIMLSRDITERRRAEESLKKLSQAIEQSPSSVIITDLKANIEYVNEAFIKTTGYSIEEVIGKNPRLLRSGKTPQSAYEEMWTCLNGGRMWRGEFINRRKDGSEYIEAVRMSPVRQADGSITHYLAVKEDITERKAAERKLVRSEASLRAILDNVPYLIWLKDADSRFIAVNQAFFKTTGLASIDEVPGKTDFDLWPKELAEKYRADDAEVMSTRQQKLTEERSMDNDRVLWVETFKAPILDGDGNLIGTTGFARDITERKQTEEVVRHMAHFDALTDLPNRVMLYDRIDQSLMKARREKTRIAIALLDLDKFKPINDTYGHAVGDLLLQEAAKRMKDCVRESDTVSRLGGDEFVVLLPAIETAQDAIAVTEKILHALNQPFDLAGHRLEISASIGISIYPEHGDNETTLVKNADIAMYHSKKSGRNNIQLYQPELEDR